MEQTVQKSATQVHHLHSVTSSRLMTVDLDAELRTAALLLANPGVGLVVICAKGGEAAGVLSKSDLVRHLATSKSNEAMVTALMSRPIVSCGPDDDLHSVWETMAGRSLQNIPVLDAASKPIGIQSAASRGRDSRAHANHLYCGRRLSVSGAIRKAAAMRLNAVSRSTDFA